MIEINIPWNESRIDSWWNLICADIVNHFGLPGDKYTTEVSENHMKFLFRDPKEALLCKIMISHHL